MGIKVTNNAFGTLNAGINSSATTIVLTAGQGARFPTLSAGDYFYATLIDTSNNLEIVKVTARSTDTMTVVRAQDNTTARAYSTNDRFELRPTAALFNEKANDDEVVKKSGSTMTGTLNISGANLNVGSTANYGGLLSVNRAQTSGIADLLTLRDASAGTTFDLETYGDPAFGTANRFNFDGAYLAFRRATVEHLRMSSGGQITMPLQPAFNVQMNDTNYTSTTPQTVVWDDVYVNRGSHYSTSNGRFTAPIAGVYFFAWHFLGRNLTSGGRTALYRNGSLYGSGNSHTYSGLSGETMHSATAMVSMNANDYVDVRVWIGSSGAGDFYGATNCHNGFSGFLAG